MLVKLSKDKQWVVAEHCHEDGSVDIEEMSPLDALEIAAELIDAAKKALGWTLSGRKAK
jgi:pyruvate/oxaloacetate carboxyltransferase